MLVNILKEKCSTTSIGIIEFVHNLNFEQKIIIILNFYWYNYGLIDVSRIFKMSTRPTLIGQLRRLSSRFIILTNILCNRTTFICYNSILLRAEWRRFNSGK